MTSVEYIFHVARSSTVPPTDNGAVAVIDGNILKITPFRSANVPPPMSLYELSAMDNVIDVAFNRDCSTVAVLHHSGIALYDWKITGTSSSEPVLNGRVTFSKGSFDEGPYEQLCFDKNNDIIVLQYENGTETKLHSFGVNKDTGRMDTKAHNFDRISSVAMISSYDQDGSINPFAQDSLGGLHSLGFDDRVLADVSFPMFLPWVDVVKHGDDGIAFGLSGNGHLYANSRLLVKNCTSFLLTPAHLVFTTTTHLLKFVHITGVQGWSSIQPYHLYKFANLF
jgi:elongator complex protein 1